MEDIITALKKIGEPGSFCSKRSLALDDFHVEVKQFGALKLPLKHQAVKALIKLAKPAKFGFRDTTLLDKKVRDAWEISKANIKINKTQWNKEFNGVVDSLKKDLGLAETTTLKASLHNLLIYEPGQFFDYHQDSEKLSGMVATLIVVLPCSHQGGTLVIDNQGVKKQFQSSRFALDKLTFIAFYADCHHTIKKLTEGYRCVLTYNLILENSTPRSKPNDKKSYDTLAKNLEHYFKEERTKRISRESESPTQLVYLLDHCYSQKGLSWNHLKNGDAERAEALKAAAHVLDLDIYLALADVQETWDCESEYDPYYYRRRQSYYANEDDQGTAGADNDREVTELIDSSTVLKHWVNPDNQPLNFKEYSVSGSYIAWTKASNELKPFQSEYEGFMGNYGNTLERWYHRAAIILWRKKDHYPILFQIDPVGALSELLKKIGNKSQETEITHIIHSLLPYWSNALRKYEGSQVSAVFKLGWYLKNPQLAQSMLITFDIGVLTPERATLLLRLQEIYGTSWCIQLLQAWAKPKERWDMPQKCKKISEIILRFSYPKNHPELTAFILNYQLKKMVEEALFCKKHNDRATLIESIDKRIQEIKDFVQACVTANNPAIYIELLNHLLEQHELYPAIELVNVLEILKKNLPASNLEKWGYKKLFNDVSDQLEAEKKSGLRASDDWSINEKSSCDCRDCKTLQDFLRSEILKTLRWPLSKDRRQHIHRIIDGLKIPVSHQTEHKGSPHTLVLSKTDKLHKETVLRFSNLKKALNHLVRLKDRKKQKEFLEND